MGWRFRRSKKILPGVRINFNKNSTSISFGGKGARYTISSTGKRTTTVGIPGTGLSYSTTSTAKKKPTASAAAAAEPKPEVPKSKKTAFEKCVIAAGVILILASFACVVLELVKPMIVCLIVGALMLGWAFTNPGE